MSLEAKKFLDNKQEQHFKRFGVYADVNSKLAEWMQEYKDKTISKKFDILIAILIVVFGVIITVHHILNV